VSAAGGRGGLEVRRAHVARDRHLAERRQKAELLHRRVREPVARQALLVAPAAAQQEPIIMVIIIFAVLVRLNISIIIIIIIIAKSWGP
jgi:hypothetical protein